MAKSTRARAAVSAMATKSILSAALVASLMWVAPASPSFAGGATVRGKVALNLLSRGSDKRKTTTRRVSSVGGGSYICSPAGFGQPSRCYAN
ncbi:hypothetical protein GFB49_12780 [Epibacterium sp. SM1979]|uniref:Uncharacterized protein n=1 Tax=Tritonibacter litoralis TaxID=2662264 RepID=A0A843YIS4_9RHOB|nr:hypothetical protein [Tritonibacter litoralis]MQQ09334.1 hypothetical protein [Tritonibacter litoralis]